MPRAAINNYTLEYIHDQFLTERSTEDIATQLKVKHEAIRKHLGKFNYEGKPLTITKLRKISKNEAEKAWGDSYTAHKHTPIIHSENFTLQEIHPYVLNNERIHDAACHLKITPLMLIRFLARFYYENETLTFERLQNIEIKNAEIAFGYTYTLRGIKGRNLTDCTIKEIHDVCSSCGVLTRAAALLGVGDSTLTSHLAKYRMDFATFQSQKPEDIERQFGDAYHQPMPADFIDISTYTLAALHATVHANDNIGLAAAKLGTSAYHLKTALARYDYEDLPLSFTDFKNLSVSKAQDLWPDTYNQLIKKKTRKRKRYEWEESKNETQQIPPPIPVPKEKPFEVAQALTHQGFFSNHVAANLMLLPPPDERWEQILL